MAARRLTKIARNARNQMSHLKRHYAKQFTIAAMPLDDSQATPYFTMSETTGGSFKREGPFFDGDYYGFIHKGIVHSGYKKAIYRDKAYKRKLGE